MRKIKKQGLELLLGGALLAIGSGTAFYYSVTNSEMTQIGVQSEYTKHQAKKRNIKNVKEGPNWPAIGGFMAIGTGLYFVGVGSFFYLKREEEEVKEFEQNYSQAR